ncbi:MAG: Rieske (2Fe-2S) protein [Candidatus Tectomicrobia bacterium]|uniref:Rieske (2Fe-2S) protein n=1 Tax=Tectimicrobiota bacterium TaxID=2528274 RepID=A0A938B1U9_UNCTE|nr:Rieske (2Fe-2S) protein [Candidatus Tectomicrobia bacterium]
MQEQPTPPGAAPGSLDADEAQRTLTRRRFARLGWFSLILAAVGGQVWFLLKLFFAPTAPGEGRGQFVLGPPDTVPVGKAQHFRKARCIVAHHTTGFLAFSDECTHQKCTVTYLPERNIIFCPCHSAQFSTTGTVLGGPAPRPLDRFVIHVQDGQIVVDTTQRLTTPSAG